MKLLDSPDEELMEKFGHWYIPRRQPLFAAKRFVVLGNSGNRDDPAIDRVLSKMPELR